MLHSLPRNTGRQVAAWKLVSRWQSVKQQRDTMRCPPSYGKIYSSLLEFDDSAIEGYVYAENTLILYLRQNEIGTLEVKYA